MLLYLLKCLRALNKMVPFMDSHKLSESFFRHRISGYFTAGELQATGMEQGTDKASLSHSFDGVSYLDVYEHYFASRKDEEVHVLEIGVKNGESLQTWKRYFSKGHCYGIDIDPRCEQLQEARVHVAIGSQDDKAFLRTCFPERRQFDIIIDDGSHINRHILTSFNYLFAHRLKPGGLYAIEDLACSYLRLQETYDVLKKWPGMAYNDPTQSYDNDREELNRFFQKHLRDTDHKQGQVLFMHFWNEMCIFGKRRGGRQRETVSRGERQTQMGVGGSIRQWAKAEADEGKGVAQEHMER